MRIAHVGHSTFVNLAAALGEMTKRTVDANLSGAATVRAVVGRVEASRVPAD